jgi:MFS family permease
MAGTLVGGLVVAQISRRDDRWKLWAPAITSGLAGPVFAVCMLTSDFATMVAALALTSFLVGFHLGPIFAIAQTVARPSMRVLASAIILLTATCFGQGAGPLAVGSARRAVVRICGAVDLRRYRTGDLSPSAQRAGVLLQPRPGLGAISLLPLRVKTGFHQSRPELHRIGFIEDHAFCRKIGLQ